MKTTAIAVLTTLIPRRMCRTPAAAAPGEMMWGFVVNLGQAPPAVEVAAYSADRHWCDAILWRKGIPTVAHGYPVQGCERLTVQAAPGPNLDGARPYWAFTVKDKVGSGAVGGAMRRLAEPCATPRPAERHSHR